MSTADITYIVIKYLRKILDVDTLNDVEWHMHDIETEGNGSDCEIFRVIFYQSLKSMPAATLKYQYIVKSPLNSIEYLESKNLAKYDTEVNMYTKILPQIDHLLCHVRGYIAPNLLAVLHSHVIVLADLVESSFEKCSIDESMDRKCLKAVLPHLAKLHAASVKLLEMKKEDVLNKLISPDDIDIVNKLRDPCEGAKYKKRFYNAVKYINSNSSNAFVEKFKSALKYHVLPVNYRVDKNFASTFQSTIIEDILHTSQCGLKVLNHMDLCQSNIFVKRGLNYIAGVKFIDFQFSNWANPAIDILHLFITSSTFETYQTYGDELLKIYIDSFHQTLNQLECESQYADYNLCELKNDINDRFSYGMLVTTHFLAVEKAENKQRALDLEDVECLKLERYQKHAKPWLDHFVQKIKHHK